MTTTEFYLWLNCYLEALESEGIDACKISNIREKMAKVKNNAQERVVFGPNANQPQQKIPPYGPHTPTAGRSIP